MGIASQVDSGGRKCGRTGLWLGGALLTGGHPRGTYRGLRVERKIQEDHNETPAVSKLSGS